MKKITKTFEIDEVTAKMLAVLAERTGKNQSVVIAKLIGEGYNWTGMKKNARLKRLTEIKKALVEIKSAQDSPDHPDFWKFQYFCYLYGSKYNKSLFFEEKGS